jgi:hypothetical protein
VFVVIAVLLARRQAWHDTMADPSFRRATITLMPAYPTNAPPVTIALISDIHVAVPTCRLRGLLVSSKGQRAARLRADRRRLVATSG